MNWNLEGIYKENSESDSNGLTEIQKNHRMITHKNMVESSFFHQKNINNLPTILKIKKQIKSTRPCSYWFLNRESTGHLYMLKCFSQTILVNC